MGGCNCHLFFRTYTHLDNPDGEHLNTTDIHNIPEITFDLLSTKQAVVDNTDSTDADSDLGSEYLSYGYDSYCSELGTVKTGDTKEVDLPRTHTPSPNERAFLCSHLGPCKDDGPESIETIQWKKGQKLGRGTFGTVFCGLTITGEMIAVKQIELNSDFSQAEKEYDRIYGEVCLLRTLKHDNIVGYFGSCYQDDTISVFMECVPGGTLQSILAKFGPLEETVTSRYTQQILQALHYLHRNNIVHRDIKSANIMLMPDGVIKLIDFGCAKRLCAKLVIQGSNMQKSLMGTPYWMAPEIANASGHGRKSDIWSLGCTVFEMCTGKPPWADRPPLAAMYASGSSLPAPHLPNTFSEKVCNFVDSCLIKDKLKRPTAEELLLHSFISTKNRNSTTGITVMQNQTYHERVTCDLHDLKEVKLNLE